MGPNPGVAGYLLWKGAQRHDSICLAKVESALNGYLVKFWEDKEEGCVRVKGSCRPGPLPLHFLAQRP